MTTTAHTPECIAANDRGPVELCICPGGPDADEDFSEEARAESLRREHRECMGLDPDEPGFYGTADGASEVGPEVYPTTFYVVRVNGDRSDTHAAETLEAALELAMPDEGDRIDYGTVRAVDAGAARLMQPSTWRRYERPQECLGHESLDGPIGNVIYCDGSCRVERVRASIRRVAQSMGGKLACALLLSVLSWPAFAAPPCKVNVNTATSEQLHQLLARTGPVLALRLVSGRPYGRLEAVDAVKGVGPYWLAVNGPHVAFQGPTTCTAKVAAPKAPRVAEQTPKL